VTGDRRFAEAASPRDVRTGDQPVEFIRERSLIIEAGQLPCDADARQLLADPH
jgi:hypothetical protein